MLPRVSIIIATRNEEDSIENCIHAIIEQDYPNDKLELLIVDGCSDDNTVGVVAKIANQRKFHVKIFNNDKIIQSSAWNIGINESSGEIILIVSAHSFIEKDYVKNAVHYLEKTKAEIVGGPMVVKGGGYIGETIGFIHHCKFGIGVGKFHDISFEGYVDTVYLTCYGRSIVEKVGYYDERLIRNQDIEFNSRVRKCGGKIYLTPELKSYYRCRDTLKGLWNQNFKNGKWVIYTKKIAPYCFSWRHFIPLAFVGTLIVSGILSVIGNLFGLNTFYSLSFLIFVTIIISYTLVTLFFSFRISFEKGLKYFAILPIVFSTLHFSYGLGSICGLITVRGLRNTREGYKLR